jgi:hypothetical protein
VPRPALPTLRFRRTALSVNRFARTCRSFAYGTGGLRCKISRMSEGEHDRRSVTTVVNRRVLTMVVLALPLISGAAAAGLSSGWLGAAGAPVRPGGAVPSFPAAPPPADGLTVQPQTEPPAESSEGSSARAPAQPRETSGGTTGRVVDPAPGAPPAGGGTDAPTDDGRADPRGGDANNRDDRGRDDRGRDDRGRNDRGRDDRGRDDRGPDDRGRDDRRDGRGPNDPGRDGPYHTDGRFGRSY